MNYKKFYITYCYAMGYKKVKRLLPNAFLILCFGLFSSNAALADQVVNISPIIVQPEDLSEISQQMLEQDRVNRDQELAIRGLIDDNQRLADTALARQQDATLEKINETMKHYRDALLSRDQERILPSGLTASKYYDLITLTENVDDLKDVGRVLHQKSNVIGEKYQALTDLKDELAALNEKLKREELSENFSKTPSQQGDRIQFLTQRLGEMDRKIDGFDKILAEKDQQISDLKNNLAKVQNELVSKEDAIRWLNQVLAVTKNKAEYYRLTAQRQQTSQQEQKVAYLPSTSPASPSPRLGDLIILAKQLIGLQEQEAALLEEKGKLWGDAYTVSDQHIQDLENRMSKKVRQLELLKSELENKKAVEVQTKGSLQQLAQQQDKVDLLKQELESKITEANKMTLMMSDYQGKISFLNAQVQEKEARLIKAKKDMYDLQESAGAKDREDQSKELSLSMVQQKAMDEKTKEYQEKIKSLKTELALDRQQLESMPSLDEISFLREGLKKADMQLKQKDQMLSQTKADADKYENNYKLQSLDYQNLKTQLQSTYDEIHQDNIDLKDKDLEITRLKERNAIEAGEGQSALEAQLKQKDEMLAQAKANAAEYERKYKEQSKEFQSLKVQLQAAYDEISRKNEDLKYKNLEVLRLKERFHVSKVPENKGEDLGKISKGDIVRQKLKQALDEIQEQGRVINILVQKLQDAGQSVNLKQYLSK